MNVSIPAMQFLNDKSGLILDLDNTIAKIRWYTMVLNPHKTSQLAKLKIESDRLRGMRFSDLSCTLEKNLNETISEFDDISRELYTPSSLIRTTLSIIEKWDEMKKPKAIVSDHYGIGKLQSLGLTNGWTTVINCREHNAFKPLPDGLWAAAAQMGLPPCEIVFIGDRKDTDGLAACAFGCQFIAVDQLPTKT